MYMLLNLGQWVPSMGLDLSLSMSDILSDSARGIQYKIIILLVAIYPAPWRNVIAGENHTNMRREWETSAWDTVLIIKALGYSGPWVHLCPSDFFQ